MTVLLWPCTVPWLLAAFTEVWPEVALAGELDGGWAGFGIGLRAGFGVDPCGSAGPVPWLVKARALFEVTTIPSVGKRQQDGARTRSPLISTMQVRQLPSGLIPSM